MKKYAREISEIKRILEEGVELEYYNMRNCTVQFRVVVTSGEQIPDDYEVLASFDITNPREYPRQNNDCRIWTNQDYYGKIELIYCKKMRNDHGGEKLKKEKFCQRIYTQKEWRQNPQKICLMDFIERKEGAL